MDLEQIYAIDSLAEYANHEMFDLDRRLPDFCTEEKDIIHEVITSLGDIRNAIKNWPSDGPTANSEQRIQSDGR